MGIKNSTPLFSFGYSYHSRCLLHGLVLSLLTLLPLVSSAAEHESSREIRDLQYGEVLFHFYQGDYFTSITHLQAAQQMNQLTHHQLDADLLLGGLMLSYGLHDKAESIFDRLLNPQSDNDVHDRAWFYLAKLRYQLGETTEAQDALDRIGPTNRDPDYRLLLTDVLMVQGKYQQVIEMLDNSAETADLYAYSRYNLGVALIKNGRVKDGITLLNELGSREITDTDRDTETAEEVLALQDKANLALGYYYIQLNNPYAAQTYLERVRLNGMFSNRALLGIGWAESASGHFQKALVPWNELSMRSVTDTSVQEALLAMPYALEKLQAFGQAVDHYDTAIDVFESEIDNINTVRQSIVQDGIADKLLQFDPGVGMGWLWQLRDVPETSTNQYLLRLLADYKFQEALKNYRDLRFLSSKLDYWQSSMGAFDDILALRKETYESRLPQIQASYQRLNLDKTREQRDIYAARLAKIEAENDALALATAKEQKLWVRIQHAKEILSRHPNIDPMQDNENKLSLIQGLYIWQINQDYKARLWDAHKHINELDNALAQAQRQQESLLKVQQTAPRGFEGYGGHIASLKDRLHVLQSRVKQARATQEHYLQGLVLDELDNRQAHLRTYLNQARYGMAQIFDTATRTTGDTP